MNTPFSPESPDRLTSLERSLAGIVARVIDSKFGFGAHPSREEMMAVLNSDPATARIMRENLGGTAHGGLYVGRPTSPEQP